MCIRDRYKGNPVPFVMELPNYRVPSPKSVLLLMWDKAKDFLTRAFTVIFIATIIIWFLQTFDTRLNVVADSSASMLAGLGRMLAPLFAPLGFTDWRAATALITGFSAKEAVAVSYTHLDLYKRQPCRRGPHRKADAEHHRRQRPLL